MARVRTIGTNALTYPELRNFAGHAYSNYQFKKVVDFYKIPSFLLFKLRGKINRKWLNSFMDFGLNHCAFYHFFNVINLGKKPNITTYETTLPRWKDTASEFKVGLELLARKNCVQLIAISQSAYNRQAQVIKTYRPDLFEQIMQKNRVLLPPQTPFLENFSEKRALGNTIVFTIVGADFFRKGGEAIMAVFDQLIEHKHPVHLNIVSTLNYGDYASKSSKNNLDRVLSIIHKYPQNITHYQSLSNDQVKKLLLDTDVALLPSLAETFGYFILEAQAAGCPVITTDIRAMPEINNESRGWLVKICLENKDEADLSMPEKLINNISSQLKTIILEILKDPSIIRVKGHSALKNIIENHSPSQHQMVLEALYESIQ